jgi:hypothetical protein
MTRKTLGIARYGLIFDSGNMAVIYAVALIQALSHCAEKPKRVIVFEGDTAITIDDGTLEKCWIKSLSC